MLMPFASGMRLWILVLLVGLNGCSLLKSKPEVVDNQVQTEGALAPELEQMFADALGLLRDKEFEQAEQELLLITSKYPDYAGPWSNLAIAQLSLKKYEASLGSINTAINIDSAFCPSLALKGVVLRELGKFTDAKIVYQQAIECNPDDVASIYNLGVLADLYLHDATTALFYYQTYLIALEGEQDSTVENWVVGLKRRVPEDQRIALVTKKPAPAEKEVVAEKGKIIDEPIDMSNDADEPQLAGEE